MFVVCLLDNNEKVEYAIARNDAYGLLISSMVQSVKTYLELSMSATPGNQLSRGPGHRGCGAQSRPRRVLWGLPRIGA